MGGRSKAAGKYICIYIIHDATNKMNDVIDSHDVSSAYQEP